jgi:hypothetical protein
MHGVKIGLDQGVMRLPRELGGLVNLGGIGCDLVVSQVAHRLAERFVLRGKGKGGKVRAHDLDGRRFRPARVKHT